MARHASLSGGFRGNLGLYCHGGRNPEQDQTLYNIPVVFTGEDILREDYDLIISESNVASGVTLTFYGKNSELNKLLDDKMGWRWRSTSPACAAPRSFPSRMI